MTPPANPAARDDLLDRRSRLEQMLESMPGDMQLRTLLGEVDEALERMESGTYGLCEICGEPIERERMIADPLIRFCIDHLSPAQRDALSEDLALASQIQGGLLPQNRVQMASWETAYHYEAANMVSGDYCDLLSHGGALYFVVGDVSGKGVPAAILMAHLHATFRALIFQGLPLKQIMSRASRMFCESSLATHFATLACGRADQKGHVELGSAGHCPVFLTRGTEIEKIDATGLPLGMFCDEQFSVINSHLEPGDSLFLYTDGLTESRNLSGEEYGMERVIHSLRAAPGQTARQKIASCIADLESFRKGATRTDDLTVMALRRLEGIGPVRGHTAGTWRS